jgi:pectinesterase
MKMKEIHVGKFNEIKTLNQALSLINEPCKIILDDEVYFEKVVINKPNLIIDGQNKAKIIYDDYAKKIHQDGREYVTFRTYTMMVKAPHVRLENLTIMNIAGSGKNVGQGVALHLYNTDIIVKNCALIAHQDTLFCGPFSDDLIERYIPLLPEDERIHSGDFYQRFDHCYIAGTVDFIFGGASVDFNSCIIETLPSECITYICAPDHDKSNTYGMRFNHCQIIKSSDTKDDSTYLARPWRDYGMVTFSSCYLSSHIKKEGFSIWEGTSRHEHARFFEENSSGPGASKKRISWAHVK